MMMEGEADEQSSPLMTGLSGREVEKEIACGRAEITWFLGRGDQTQAPFESAVFPVAPPSGQAPIQGLSLPLT